MAKNDFHSQLRDIIQKSQRVVMDYMNSLSEGERSASGTWETWAPKDQLSHITYWQRRGVEFLSYVSRGQNPPKYPPYEECNRLNFEETKDKPVEMLLREYKAVQESLGEVLKRFTEEDLRALGKHPFDKEATLLGYILHNHYSHNLTHVVDGYLKLGDTAAVDLLADQMVTDILSLDDSPRSRGTTIYNRACFYALAGSRNKALESLRESMVYRPDLKQWAKEDTDLVSLRDDPEFIALLAD